MHRLWTWLTRPDASDDRTVLTVTLLAVVAIAWLSNPLLAPQVWPDTTGYAAVARNLLDPAARDRPPAYPLLVRAATAVAGPGGWPRAVVVLQIGLLACIGACLFAVARRCAVPRRLAGLIAVVICADRGLLVASSWLLPEMLLAALVTASWALAIRGLDSRTGGVSAALAVAIGVLSGAAALAKPVWLFGFLPVAAALAMGLRADRRATLRAALIVAGAHLALCGAWQTALFLRFGQVQFSRIGTINVNTALIRAGLTQHAAGTPLYRRMADRGLLPEALALRWWDYEEFRRVRRRLTMEERADPAFMKEALAAEPGALLWPQAVRYPVFFVMPPPSSDTVFWWMPVCLRSTYGALEIVLYGVLPVLMIAGSIRGLRQRATRAMAIVSVAVVLYASVAITLLTFEDGLFGRMRVCVAPILLAMAAVPRLAADTERADHAPAAAR